MDAAVTAPAVDEGVVWRPFPGFQTRALRANADETFKGGAKGGGKTDLLIAAHLRWTHKPQYAGLFLRETYKELQRPLDRATAIFGALPAGQRPSWSGDKQRFTFPSRAFIQFGHCRTRGDLTNYQGGNWARISYDELGNQPDERVADGLISELRCPDKSIRRQFDGSGNPGFAGHGWTKRRYVVPCGKAGERVAWTHVTLPNGEKVAWSRQFIPGRVTDNPIYANDASYMAQLMLLPERMRRCLMDGDYDAASGVALDELEPRVHLCAPFEVPDHWPYVAAMDWGFAHPTVFMWGRVSDDGRIYVCDTIKRRRMRDPDLAGSLNELAPPAALRTVHAGHDCWARKQDDATPKTADYFADCGIFLKKANVDRVQGYNNTLRYLAWMETEYLPQREPAVRFFDTPTNRWLIEDHLPSIVNDPDDPRDVLKIDADDDTGLGGDDGYDCAAGWTLVCTDAGMMEIQHMVGTKGKCLTPLGWKGYHSVRRTHRAVPTLTATDEHGHSFTGTSNHLCLTSRGWVALGDLRRGDQWIAVDSAAGDRPTYAGVSGTAVLADDVSVGGVLSAPRQVVGARGVRCELRTDPARIPSSSRGWEQGQQPAGEFAPVDAKSSRQNARDGAASGATAHPSANEHGSEGAGVACFAGRSSVALTEWRESDGDAPAALQGVRAVRAGIPDDSVARAVLPPELQGDGTSAAIDRPALRFSRVVSLATGPATDTYNMEVEEAHCFAVQGGIVVHNCLRYLLASRPMKAETGKHLLKLSAWDPLVLQREAAKFRSSDVQLASPRQKPKGLYMGV